MSISQHHTIKLSKPLETPHGVVEEIRLREPPARFVLEHDLPWEESFTLGDDGRVARFEIDYRPSVMAVYIESMSGIGRDSLEQLPAKDLATVFPAVAKCLRPNIFTQEYARAARARFAAAHRWFV